MNQENAAQSKVVASALSRQAIYDAKLHSWAYDLRYAEIGSGHGPESISSDDATSSVVLSAFAEFGLERVVGKKKAFIHASVRTITGELPLPIPPARVILQVRDYEYDGAQLLLALEARKAAGFSIALDDFVYTDDVEPLLRLADYVKLSMRRLGQDGMREHSGILSKFQATPIVCALDNSSEVQFCSKLGYSNYQGDFLFKPQVLKRKELPSSFVVVSDLLVKLQDPEVPFGEIEEILKRDAGLSVAVLKFLNSSAYGFRQGVTSVTQAVSLLGLNEFMKWTLLVVMSARFDKPSELVTTALVRARTCENFAKKTGRGSPATAFMVGLLSVLDALLDRSMTELLEELPIAEEAAAAILDFHGPAGEILERVVTREQDVPELGDEEQATLTEAWLDAVEWADRARAATG